MRDFRRYSVAKGIFINVVSDWLITNQSNWAGKELYTKPATWRPMAKVCLAASDALIEELTASTAQKAASPPQDSQIDFNTKR